MYHLTNFVMLCINVSQISKLEDELLIIIKNVKRSMCPWYENIKI